MDKEEFKGLYNNLDETLEKIAGAASELHIKEQMGAYLEKNEEAVVQFLLSQIDRRPKFVVKFLLKRNVLNKLKELLS